MQFFLEDAKNQTEQVSGLLVSKWLIDFLAGCTSQDGGSKSSHYTWAPYNLSWPLPGQRGRVCVHSSQIGEACDHGKGDTLWLLKAMPYKWIKFLSSSLDTLALGTLPQCCDEARQHQREATCMCSGWQPSLGPTCQLTSVIGLCVNKSSDDSGPHKPSPDLSHPSSWFVELFLESPAQIAGLWADKGASQMALVVKNLPTNAGDLRDVGLNPESGRSPGGGHGSPLQYSCLENPMSRGTQRATVHGVKKSWTQLKWLSTSK